MNSSTFYLMSMLCKYKEEFIHWDVSSEMLHFDFYEQRLGPNATLHFYEIAHMSDPLATFFMNEFNVVETCSDTTKKESINEVKIPSQKFKYRRKRLLARVYNPRRPSYLLLLLKEILRPYLRK